MFYISLDYSIQLYYYDYTAFPDGFILVLFRKTLRD